MIACGKKSLKILVVDDDVVIHLLIEIIFRETIYAVEYAENGIKALSALQQKSDFDLILMDANMPHMDGFEVCSAIRQITGLNEIPVIFLTGSDEPENIIKGFEVGAQDYVLKPFDSKELMSRLHTHLQRKHKTGSDNGEVPGT